MAHPTRLIDVRFVPAHIDPQQLAGSTCVVIDTLRASTTICWALAQGARRIRVCQEVDHALALKSGGQVDLLGGERQGMRIDQFDLGNSPREYSTAVVANKRIAFTTTNGTRALGHCRFAGSVLVGCLLNRQAVCDQLPPEQAINLVCAATRGEVSSDDALTAGAMVDALRAGGAAGQLTDRAIIALGYWRGCLQSGQSIEAHLRQSAGGLDLVRLGLDADIRFAAQLDWIPVVPQFDPQSQWIAQPP